MNEQVIDHTNAARLTPVERAALRGWSVDPALTPGNPHDWKACACSDRQRSRNGPCDCTCHGRTFIHYRRGA